MRCFLLSIPVVSYRFLPQDQLPAQNIFSDVQRKYTPRISDVPYHVLIVYGNSFCSGSIISSLTVLTAASCFWRYTGQDVIVKAGTNVISEDANVYAVESIKIHEYYKYRSDMDNDIALLLLKNHVAFSDALKKVILIEPETAVRAHAPLVVSGWSTVKLAPKFGNVLLWSEMIVVNIHDCILTYKGFISPSNFCAKFNLERRLYDNGGPAVFQNFLVGIMSFGAMKVDEPHLAVFTNVSYFYRIIGAIDFSFCAEKLGRDGLPLITKLTFAISDILFHITDFRCITMHGYFLTQRFFIKYIAANSSIQLRNRNTMIMKTEKQIPHSLNADRNDSFQFIN